MAQRDSNCSLAEQEKPLCQPTVINLGTQGTPGASNNTETQQKYFLPYWDAVKKGRYYKKEEKSWREYWDLPLKK